jgi:hypothetical protein
VYDVRYFFADTAFTVYEYVPFLTGPDSTGPFLSISIFDIVYLLPFVLCNVYSICTVPHVDRILHISDCTWINTLFFTKNVYVLCIYIIV